MRRPWLLALGLFGLALALRLAALGVFLPQLDPQTNLDDYRGLARSLAAGHGFVVPQPDGPVYPSAERTPVYPLFLAALLRVAGDRLGVLLAAQCVLGAATAALTFVLARRWLSVWPAAIAAGLVALDPNSIIRCVDLRTETLFTLLLLGGACLLAWRTHSPSSALLAGVLWSLAALCRPIALWLPVPLLAVWLLQRWRWPHYACFLAGFLPLLGLWCARNHALTGRWFFCSISTAQTTLYRAAGVEADRRGQPIEVVQQQLLNAHGQIAYIDDREEFGPRLDAYRRAAISIFTAAPWLTLQHEIIGWGRILIGPGTRSLDHALRQPGNDAPWWAPVYAGGLVVFTTFGLAGMVRWRRPGALLTALIIYLVVLAGGSAANSRFRTPIVPLLAVTAVVAVRPPRP